MTIKVTKYSISDGLLWELLKLLKGAKRKICETIYQWYLQTVNQDKNVVPYILNGNSIYHDQTWPILSEKQWKKKKDIQNSKRFAKNFQHNIWLLEANKNIAIRLEWFNLEVDFKDSGEWKPGMKLLKEVNIIMMMNLLCFW